jgi:hypothetical protein
MRTELPWEVQLLLSMRDAEPDSYELYVQMFEEQYAAGDMSTQEFARFVEAFKQLAAHDEKMLGLVRRALYPKPHLVGDGQ